MSDVQQVIEPIIARLKSADWKAREAIKDELLAAAEAHEDRDAMKRVLEEAKKGLDLERRWDVDEVLEALQPPPEPEPEPEEEEEQAAGQPRMVLVYDDPRGLRLHRTEDGSRWFATQPDPYTGQPQTFEVPPAQVAQLKAQLQGSPYWMIGA
ncbi:MAG: hypothetical protein EP330_24525 [Deltaproteobacteria bacterium]|nr:MAG: hypothetical protein EP330_24525 [Deltaproteobacteria bacterium]